MAFTVTAANIEERDVVPNLYGTIRGLLIGDKGFISGDLKWEAAAQEIDSRRRCARTCLTAVIPAPSPV